MRSSESRETSGATTCLIVRYVREHGDADAVARLLERSAVPFTVAELEEERNWFTYEDKIALFEAAAEVLDDPDVTRRIGESALQLQVGAGLRILLRTLGSPRVVVSNIARACPKFSTVATMDVVELGRDHATVTYQLRSDKQPHRLDCLLNQGLLAVIGPVFGQPLLRVRHRECQVHGAERCVYEIRWTERRWGRPRRASQEHHDEQVSALVSQLEALQSTAADLVSADDWSQVLERIVARAGVAVHATGFLLAVQRPNEPMIVHSDGFPTARARVLGEALLAGKPVKESLIVQEVVSATRRYGVIAASIEDHLFFEQEEALLGAYARSAAAVLDAATALEDAMNREQQTMALLGLAAAVSEIASPREIAQRLAEAMPTVLGGSASLVFLTEGERLRVRARHGWGMLHGALLDDLVIDRDTDGIIAAWLDAPEPRLITMKNESSTVQSMLCALAVDALAMVPLNRRGTLLGVAGVAFNATELPADVEELLRRSSAVADIAATALENASLLAQVRHRALHDELTGLPNRAYFEEQVEQALERAARDATPVTLLFVDVNRFKAVNDRYGHDAGDRLLADIASRMSAQARGGDIVARLGGDEFAAMLWGADETEGCAIAERLREAARVPIEENGAPVTSASFGIATAKPGERLQELLRRADTAMYEAKRTRQP